GRLIEHLKKIGEYENTIFVFFSDNGPEGANRAELERWQTWFEEEGIDNSYENMGKPNSFITLNKGWVQASSTPFLWFKGRVSEGGIRVPAIFAYSGVIPAGSRSDAFGSVLDLMPSLLGYAGVEHPGSSYNGREIYPMDGRSLEPVLAGKSDRVYTEEDSIAFELFGYGNSALFQGDWKILKLIPPWGDGEWKLFNIRQDPRELTNLARQYPDRLKEMITLYEQYEEEKGVISTTEVLYK
ncbi:MAG: sulfatase-like hydrolase/transferase, partial [Microcoleaceae cyanobacterium]